MPLATSKCFPSGVTRTEMGYQPTGMKPKERLFPGLLEIYLHPISDFNPESVQSKL